MNLSRRKFIAFGLIAGAVPLYTWYAWRWGNPTDIIVAILKRRVGYLRIEPATFRDFAKNYISSHEAHKNKLAALSIASPLLQTISPYQLLRQGSALRRLEDSVVSDYLLSTDFFFNGANEERVISYIGLYDPYSRPCSNPFNRQP